MPADLRPVEPDFLETAPHVFTTTEVLSRPAVELFSAIAVDPAGWGGWFPGFSSAGRYLTAPPHGVGSQRRMSMAGMTYHETVIAWEEPGVGRPGRYSFRVDRSTVPVAWALAEEYRVFEHDGSSILQWTFAIDPRRVLRPALRWMDPILAALFRRVAANLEAPSPSRT